MKQMDRWVEAQVISYTGKLTMSVAAASPGSSSLSVTDSFSASKRDSFALKFHLEKFDAVEIGQTYT
jgi:hypothetical protein